MKDKNIKKSKVYIAGAGCGDEGLITLKLKNVIEKADCIIYDRLVNKNILQYAKPDAELIYMGKENTAGGKLQTEINERLVEKAKKGFLVLRLKGGDPFVFGRGGEEIEALVSENINFEVIPGITSSIAVPAYAGIPVTHRGVNISFHVFTGHTQFDGTKLDFPVIAKLEGTLIFLMGLSNLEKIITNLIQNGKNPQTPIAIIKDGSLANQKTYTGTLETIINTVKEHNVKSPAVIVIGEVVNLREKMKWFENRQLFGKNILVTRNKEKQGNITNKINEFGGQSLNLPFINIEYIDFEMPDLKKYSTLLFNSVNSVIGFMRKVQDIRSLGNIKIGVVGEKTAEEIKKHKIVPDFYPKEYTVKKLAEESVNFTKEREKILFIVSDISPVDTQKYSDLYNRNYEKLVVYKTQKVKVEKEKTENYIKKSDILMFLSSSTFQAFADSIELKENPKIKEILNNKIIASIGPVTTETIEKYGLKVGIEPKKYTEEGLFEAILKLYSN